MLNCITSTYPQLHLHSNSRMICKEVTDEVLLINVPTNHQSCAICIIMSYSYSYSTEPNMLPGIIIIMDCLIYTVTTARCYSYHIISYCKMNHMFKSINSHVNHECIQLCMQLRIAIDLVCKILSKHVWGLSYDNFILLYKSLYSYQLELYILVL